VEGLTGFVLGSPLPEEWNWERLALDWGYGWFGGRAEGEILAFRRVEAPLARLFCGTPEGVAFRVLGFTRSVLDSTEWSLPGVRASLLVNVVVRLMA